MSTPQDIAHMLRAAEAELLARESAAKTQKDVVAGERVRAAGRVP